MANVSLKGVYKFYEKSDTPAVDNFNLEIKDKEFVVFVGPSGCGKSTTLRMIAGLEEITYGDILIDGRKVNNVEPKDRNIAMVFQNYALYPHMTVYKNMAFGLTLARRPLEERDKSFCEKGKNGKPLNVFVRPFVKKNKELRDEKDNIVYADDGTPVYENRVHTKHSLRLGRTRAEKRDAQGNVVTDENGNAVFEVRCIGKAFIKLQKVPREQLDKNGNIVLGKDGKPVYVAKKDKNGNAVSKKGVPVYEMRKLTAEEIASIKSNPIAKVNRYGETVYKTRRFTKQERKELIGAPVYDRAGKPVYQKRHLTDEERLGRIVTDENGNPVFIPVRYTKLRLAFARIYREQRDENGNVVTDAHGNALLEPKRRSTAFLRFKKVPQERLDGNGNIVRDGKGRPKYVVKSYKKGKEKTDKYGDPVYAMRRLTAEEIAAIKANPPVKKNYNGEVIYKKRRFTAEEKAGLLGKNAKNLAGEPVYNMRKYTKEEIDRHVREAARILDITQYLARKPMQLSGGQRQRVAIGRSIVRFPKVFLFDEPLSNLDAKLRNQMRAEIMLLRKKIDTTFVYVTHDQVEAMTLGDRIVIMKDGVIQQIGTPTEVFNHPANLFVAGFIGTPQMNFFNAKLVRRGDKYFARICGGEFPLRDEVSAHLAEINYPECDITLGVRPEHISVITSRSKNAVEGMAERLGAEHPAQIEADVNVSEMMGSELYVHTATPEGDAIVVRIPTMTLSKADMENIMNGGRLTFTFMPQVMHVFDKETQLNLIPIEKIAEGE